MAVLESIRSRGGTIVVVIIGLALVSFVLQDMFSSGNSSLFGSSDSIGEINGHSISGKDFGTLLNDQEEKYKRNQGTTSVDENTRQQLINKIWNDYLDQYLFNEQIEDAGVAVHEDELFDMIQGDNIDQQVQNIPIFKDSITQQFDRNKVFSFLKTQLSDEKDPDGKYRQAWAEFEQDLMKQRRKTKFNNLIKKAMYVTSAQAKRDYLDKTKNVTYRLVEKKYDTIADSTLKVTDDEIKKYYDEHKHEFEQNDETRKLEYVVFQVNPTPEDRQELMKSMEALKVDFSTTNNDTLFVNANSADPFQAQSVRRGALPAQVDSSVFSGTPGMVYGPYIDGEQIKLAKLKGFKASSDSVSARHILISTREGMDEAKAMAKADSIKKAIQAGANFSLMAIQFSNDDGSKVKGGDLGWFTEGRMVPEFNDACFNGNKGDMPIVKTQYGVHIIEIMDKTKPMNKADVVTISRKIEPSSATNQNVFAQANDFAVSAENYDAFKKKAAEKNFFVVKFPTVRPSDKQVNDLTESRELVMWTYGEETEVNTISKVYEFSGKYVVAALTGVKDKGIPSFEQLKEDLEPLAKREKKADKFEAEYKAAMASAKTIDALGTKMNLAPDVSNSINFAAYQVSGHGFEPKLIGSIPVAKPNVLSAPVRGNSGVYVFVVEGAPASVTPPADLSAEKKQIVGSAQGRADNGIYTSLLKKAKVDDKRYRFF